MKITSIGLLLLLSTFVQAEESYLYGHFNRLGSSLQRFFQDTNEAERQLQEGNLCSESIQAIVNCVAETCPEQSQAGTCVPDPDADNCEDVEGICQELTTCCGGCSSTIEAVIDNCVPGAVCEDISCAGDGPDPTDPPLDPDLPTDPPVNFENTGVNLDATNDPDPTDDGGDGDLCSESIQAIVNCVANQCPEETEAGSCNVQEDADSCEDVEAICQAATACCDNSCGDTIEAVIDNCVPGAVCEGIDCTGDSPDPTDPPVDPDPTDPPVDPDPTDPPVDPDPTVDGGDGDLCSESIQLIVNCVADQCPEETEAGSCNVQEDADTCEDVEAICQAAAACCDNSCGDAIEAVIDNCVPGDLCEGIDCTGDSPDPDPPVDPDPTDPPVDPDPTDPPVDPPTVVPATTPPPTPFVIPPTDPPLTCPELGCCMDDCCGAKTSWDANLMYCVEDPSSDGWDGSYTDPDYDNTECADRSCCESDCCGSGTVYDTDIKCCVPSADPDPTDPPVDPDPPVDGGDGDLCSESIQAIVNCVADQCPEETQAGSCNVQEDANSCADVEAICQAAAACCDNSCGDAIEAVIDNCVPGDLCEGIDCTN